MQIKMQEVNDVLASHFDEFGQKVVEAYIRPLKIKDSVPKYRVPIQTILTGWIQDEALLLMESFFSTLKQEELYRSSYRSENEFKKRVSEYMKFYNKRRPHRANQYKTPDEAENAFYEKNAG